MNYNIQLWFPCNNPMELLNYSLWRFRGFIMSIITYTYRGWCAMLLDYARCRELLLLYRFPLSKQPIRCLYMLSWFRRTSGQTPAPNVQNAGQTPLKLVNQTVRLYCPYCIPQPHGALFKSRTKSPVVYVARLEIRTLETGITQVSKINLKSAHLFLYSP